MLLLKRPSILTLLRLTGLALVLSALVFGARAGLPARAQEDGQPAPLPPTVAEGARLQTLYEADRFFEGPCWDPATGRLYFSAFGNPRPQVLRLDAPGKVTVWMDPSGGLAHTHLARSGRMLAAQALDRAILSLKIGANGPEDVRVLTKDDNGVPYIRPTDVVESPATGGIYFPDPNFEGKTRSAVYYLGADGRPRRVVEHLKIPTGVEVSPDGKTLYVSDGLDKRIYSYPILPDGSVDQGKVAVFFDPDTPNQANPDGMCLDEHGNLYCAMRGGVWVASPEGKTLGFIPVPEFCSNAAFGGPDGKTLYLTCSKKVYALRMKVSGPRREAER
jgi:gluconolactonase